MSEKYTETEKTVVFGKYTEQRSVYFIGTCSGDRDSEECPQSSCVLSFLPYTKRLARDQFTVYTVGN